LLGVLILVASAPTASMPLLDASSAKRPQEFAVCFSREVERSNGVWAYLPNDRGGTFTDSGAQSLAASYWLQVRDAGNATRLRLYASADVTQVKEAVDRCR
jgi:hypothetical protein